mgnify:CR=1 FL=1
MSEKLILVSNDESIKLTNRRLLQKTPEINREMDLEDFDSYQKWKGCRVM